METKIAAYYDDGTPMTRAELELWKEVKMLSELPLKDWQEFKERASNYSAGDTLPGFGVLTNDLIDVVQKVIVCVEKLRNNQSMDR